MSKKSDSVHVEEHLNQQIQKKIMYRSTMIPGEVSDKPGKDSMGMAMEPFEVDESQTGTANPSGLATVTIPQKSRAW